MNKDEFLLELQDIMQRDEPIALDDNLEDMEEWDSMSIMACQTWFESRLGISHPFNFYRDLQTVNDLIDASEGNIV